MPSYPSKMTNNREMLLLSANSVILLKLRNIHHFFNFTAFSDLVFRIKIDLNGRANLHIAHKIVLQTAQHYFYEHKYEQINVHRIGKVGRGRRLEDFKTDGWGQKGP